MLLIIVNVDGGSLHLVVMSLILASFSRLGYNPLKFMKFTMKFILLKYTTECHFRKADSQSCVTHGTISFQSLSPPKEFLYSLAHTVPFTAPQVHSRLSPMVSWRLCEGRQILKMIVIELLALFKNSNPFHHLGFLISKS